MGSGIPWLVVHAHGEQACKQHPLQSASAPASRFAFPIWGSCPDFLWWRVVWKYKLKKVFLSHVALAMVFCYCHRNTNQDNIWWATQRSQTNWGWVGTASFLLHRDSRGFSQAAVMLTFSRLSPHALHWYPDICRMPSISPFHFGPRTPHSFPSLCGFCLFGHMATI